MVISDGGGDAVAAMIRALDPRRSPEIVEEIVRLEKKIFPKHESLARSFHEELKKKNSGLLYVKIGKGKGEDELVGYVMYSRISSLCASITKLAVRESYRRQGYGEALMKAAIGRCKIGRIQCISLHVDPMRTCAVLLYEKLGFQIDELIESYYSSDRNAFRMYMDFTHQV